MTWRITSRQTRLYLAAATFLLIGLSSAAAIYLTADNAADGGLVNDFENSKRYVHDLELYGGKANVLADEFNRWFDGLWQGKSLASTVGCITIFVAAGVFFVAWHLPPDVKSTPRDDSNRGGATDNKIGPEHAP